jgi:hypothetical protein
MKITTRYAGRVSVAVATALFGIANVAVAEEDEADVTSFSQVEIKLKRLKKRVKQLETEVTDLRFRTLPNEVDIDCSAGDTINGILDAHTDTTGMLTIRVSGVCAEEVVITRSQVTLQGVNGATIQQQVDSGYTNVTVSGGADHVYVSDLRLVEGFTGALVTKGAHAVFSNIVFEASDNGVTVIDNGVADITASTIRNNVQGIYAARGGVASVSNSIIEQNTVGVLAFKAGTINLTSILPDQSIGIGSIVRNNTTGGVARSGGMIDLSDARIEANRGVGLLVDSGSAIQLFASFNETGNLITGNTSFGILVQKNASLVVNSSVFPQAITGNVFGIQCNVNSSYIVPPGFVVTGNTNANVVGCTP